MASAATSSGCVSSLVLNPTACRVSSVLDRNKKLYGGDHMLSLDTTNCWNSAEGSPQKILLQFHRAVRVCRLEMMFQGGFVGQDVEIRAHTVGTPASWITVTSSASADEKETVDVSPEDSNDLQSFPCVIPHEIDALQISFGSSTDFYGRVTLYRLDVLGSNVDAA